MLLGQGVNSLPKIVTRQCGGWESPSRQWRIHGGDGGEGQLPLPGIRVRKIFLNVSENKSRHKSLSNSVRVGRLLC